MASHSDKTAQTRQALIDAAKHIVADRGWGNATSRAIAGRAGVNVALINYHFDSKAELLVAALADAAAALMGEWSGEALPPLDVMLDEVISRIENAEEVTDAAVIFEATLEARHDPQVRQAVRDQLAAFRQFVEFVLTSQGVVNAAARATVLAASIDGLLLHYLVDPDLNLAGARDALARLIDTTS